MIPLHPDWQHRNQWCLLGSQGAYRLWKDDFALTQDVGKSCKKRKHNIQEAFIYHGYNVTTLPFFWVGGGATTEEPYMPVLASMACMPVLGLAVLTHFWSRQKLLCLCWVYLNTV